MATNNCFFAQGCGSGITVKKGGFDAGSFVGGMFLVIGLIVLGGGAFVVYKWKFSNRPSYTELR